MRTLRSRLTILVVLIVLPSGVLAQSAGSKGVKKEEKKAAPAALKYVATEDAPKAIGAYSQGVVAGGFLFTAGQTPRDPKTGETVAGGIEPSTERVLDNIEAILKAEGLSFSDVVKTTVYLTKAEDFQAMNGVYGRRMGDHKPARSTVIVAALPGNAPLEIDMVALAKH